jgi:hypothetical protein
MAQTSRVPTTNPEHPEQHAYLLMILHFFYPEQSGTSGTPEPTWGGSPANGQLFGMAFNLFHEEGPWDELCDSPEPKRERGIQRLQ